ncbi:protein trichome birefringence-like 19 [Lolium perenne]|uniref:protein trichome birefringence-like 19 n=1 Tax=Lolium perenne TaxID=4522 RepID=UPI0021EA387E|nr:protein trichome birefringence-like 19 [Lolium perenne]
MQKLRLVNPTALSLPAAVIVLLIVGTRLRGSFFGTYSPGDAAIPSGSRHQVVSNSTSAVVPEGCDIFRGEWVPDDGAPYYTNRSCAFIQEHQNCMKYGRPDLGFLGWRWRPDGCELPRFDAARFLQVVSNRSMAFVGDSLARNHMQSLVCLLSKVEYPKDISTTENQEFRTLYYESHGFTLSIYRSRFLVKANLSDNDADHGLWNLYLDEPDDAWLPFVSGADYIVISGASWFTHPSLFYEAGGRLVGCKSCNLPGVPELTLRYSMRAAFRTALRAITTLKGFTGTVIARTLTPTSHFEGGEWDKGGDCRRTRPYAARVGVAGQDLELHEAQVEEFAAAKEEAAARGARMMLMDATAAMVLRPDGHPSRYGHWAHENVTLYNDCVHWCLPGPVDVWNEMLLHMLLAGA